MTTPMIKDLRGSMYYWVDGEVVAKITEAVITDVYCLDDRYHGTAEGWRTGRYVSEPDGTHYWEAIKPEALPPEFRASLLLLGVST